MVMVLATVSVWAAWYAATGVGGGPVSVRLVLTSLGASGQIALTSLLLGVTGLLTPVWLVGGNLIVGIAVAGGAFWSGRSAPAEPSSALRGIVRSLGRDALSLGAGLRAGLGWETVCGGILFLFTYIWLAAAAFVYPPRGVDDLVYHLPAVYQAVQDHRFQILPLALRKFFAFPFTGDMPFLWIAALTRSVHWVGAAQIPFALLAAAAVVALARRYGLGARAALLTGAAFATMPVVVLQATSNYIDLVVNAWVLAGAVALIEYARAGRRLPLGLAGLAAGLVIGSKYQAIPLGAALIAIAGGIAAQKDPSRRGRVRTLALVLAIAAASGSYWYVRNWIQFGNPFYPLPVRVLGIELFPGDWPQGPSIWSALASDPSQLLRIALLDPGLGTYNGGFGCLAWGFALPGLGLLSWRLGRGGQELHVEEGTRRALGLVLALVPVGILVWFLSPFQDLALTARYVLSIGGLSLIGFGSLLERVRRRDFGGATVLRAAAIVAMITPLCVASASRQPFLTLAPAAKEPPEIRSLSSQRYLTHSLRDLGQMSLCWAPLDEMTRGDAEGLSVYQAADFPVFWTAPTFGSFLQNRVWQFQPSLDTDPDAYFFHSPRQRPFYLGKEVHQETVAADPRYELVAGDADDETTLYVARAALAAGPRLHRLAGYYRRASAPFVAATAASAAAFEPGSVVLAPFPFAAGYLVHGEAGTMRAALEPVTSKSLAGAVAREAGKVLYTFGTPIGDRPSTGVGKLEVEGKSVPIFRNAPGAGARASAEVGG